MFAVLAVLALLGIVLYALVRFLHVRFRVLGQAGQSRSGSTNRVTNSKELDLDRVSRTLEKNGVISR